MKDRITAGFISGFAAGIGMNVIDWTVNAAYGEKEYLYSWASVVIYGRMAENTWEIVFSQVGQLFFAGFLGIIFAYIMLKLTSRNYLFKGWLYGLIAWFGVYGISTIFRIPFISAHSTVIVTSHLLSASLYGVLLGAGLHQISKRKLV
ncbi:MAG: hypothetical protein ACOX4H_08740 [Bacillota bacterium]|jgi:hypothetical protein